MASIVQDTFREHWRELKRGQPGRRFQERYDRARHVERRSGAGRRIVMFFAAGVCLIIGVVLTFIPGPALPFLFLAGGLLATESRTIARFMDASEMRLRRIFGWAKRRWRGLPIAGRVIAILLAAACSACGFYFSLRLIRG